MFVWQGLGFLVPVILFGSALLTEIAVNKIFQDSSYYANHLYCVLMALVIGGLIIFPLGLKLNDPKKDKLLIDPKTGEEHRIGSSHTFFFIPMQYWAFIAPAICGIVWLVEVLRETFLKL